MENTGYESLFVVKNPKDDKTIYDVVAEKVEEKWGQLDENGNRYVFYEENEKYFLSLINLLRDMKAKHDSIISETEKKPFEEEMIDLYNALVRFVDNYSEKSLLKRMRDSEKLLPEEKRYILKLLPERMRYSFCDFSEDLIKRMFKKIIENISERKFSFFFRDYIDFLEEYYFVASKDKHPDIYYQFYIHHESFYNKLVDKDIYWVQCWYSDVVGRKIYLRHPNEEINIAPYYSDDYNIYFSEYFSTDIFISDRCADELADLYNKFYCLKDPIEINEPLKEKTSEYIREMIMGCLGGFLNSDEIKSYFLQLNELIYDDNVLGSKSDVWDSKECVGSGANERIKKRMLDKISEGSYFDTECARIEDELLVKVKEKAKTYPIFADCIE